MNLHTMNRPRLGRNGMLRAALPALGLLLTAPALRAQVTGAPIFETIYNQQNGSTVTPVSYNFDARVFETKTTDVGTATLTYPGPGSPGTYSLVADSTPPFLNYGPPGFTTLAALNTAFPMGNYVTQYSGGTVGTGTVTTNFTQTAFAGSTPTFSPATVTGLMGLNAAQNFTASFNSFVTGTVANESDLFFNIYNATTGANVLGDEFQPSNLTSFAVPANTLMPGTAYLAQLDFSNRINSTDANGIGNGLGFDRVTTLNFTTAPAAVPEASTTVSLGLLLALGLGGMIVAARRRKA